MESPQPPITSFTIRVYGIVIDDKLGLLLADELVKGMYVTKFPGGGLDFGEGTVECLLREMVEEAGQEAEIISHYYTTDFFLRSAFNPKQQVISIYYLCRFKQPFGFRTSEKKFDFNPEDKEPLSFRWVRLAALKKEDLTLPIDQHVAAMLISEFGS